MKNIALILSILLFSSYAFAGSCPKMAESVDAKIAEAQIEYVGAGILDSATKPGWGSKIFRAISPF